MQKSNRIYISYDGDFVGNMLGIYVVGGDGGYIGNILFWKGYIGGAYRGHTGDI